MHLSTHYYIISLSERTNALYEAFREDIIDIRNGGFPVEGPLGARNAADSTGREERLHEIIRIVDQCFGDCYRNDPLNVVVTGEKEMQRIFASTTGHRNAILGRVEGDYSATSLRDLGRIVWPVVKEAISGLVDEAMRSLEIAVKARRAVCGLNAVTHMAISGVSATLMVEDDYHVRGSITKTGQSLEISQDVNVMEEMDDAVDVVVDRVLERGGNVVFVPSGSLNEQGRIVLLPRGSEGTQ